VAKRTRVQRSASHRPGSRPAVVRPSAQRPPVARQPVPREEPAEIASTIEEALAVDVVGAAEPNSILRSTPGRLKVKPNSLLAARAETEYIYVGADLRKIVLVGLALFGVLIALWIVLVLMKVSALY
jgi:hypothetical protein